MATQESTAFHDARSVPPVPGQPVFGLLRVGASPQAAEERAHVYWDGDTWRYCSDYASVGTDGDRRVAGWWPSQQDSLGSDAQ
jgi:hypothetical protein